MVRVLNSLSQFLAHNFRRLPIGIRKYASGTLTPPAAPSVEGESSPPRAVHDALHPDSDQENEAVVEEKEWDEVVEEEEEIFDEDPCVLLMIHSFRGLGLISYILADGFGSLTHSPSSLRGKSNIKSNFCILLCPASCGRAPPSPLSSIWTKL